MTKKKKKHVNNQSAVKTFVCVVQNFEGMKTNQIGSNYNHNDRIAASSDPNIHRAWS